MPKKPELKDELYEVMRKINHITISNKLTMKQILHLKTANREIEKIFGE